MSCISHDSSLVSVTRSTVFLQVDLSRATSAVFRANMAVEGGGAIYGDESSTSFSANEYNHSLAENRFGFCFIFFGNEGQPVGATSLVRGYAGECGIW